MTFGQEGDTTETERILLHSDYSLKRQRNLVLQRSIKRFLETLRRVHKLSVTFSLLPPLTPWSPFRPVSGGGVKSGVFTTEEPKHEIRDTFILDNLFPKMTIFLTPSNLRDRIF